METRDNAFLENEPVGKPMSKYAVPCIISLLVAALYNIVDQIFIALAVIRATYRQLSNPLEKYPVKNLKSSECMISS